MGVGYFHLLVGIVTKVLKYTETCRAKGILVVPDSPGSIFGVLVERMTLEKKAIR